MYTENTLAIIRNLFRDYLEACDALKQVRDAAASDGVAQSASAGASSAVARPTGAAATSAAVQPDAVLSQSVREILPKIVPTKIGSKGQILEWNEEFEESSHITGIYRICTSSIRDGESRTGRRSFTAR